MSRPPRLPFAVITVFLLAWGSSAGAKVARTTLTALIQRSDYIILAHVESIETMNGLRVARAVPEQQFKGTTQLQPIAFIAERTWTCDTSTAVEGERVLLFLHRVQETVIQRRLLRKPPVPVSIQPLFVFAYSGRGRMPIRTVEDKDCVMGVGGDVRLPRALETKRALLLSDIVKLILRPKATPTLRSVPTFVVSQ